MVSFNRSNERWNCRRCLTETGVIIMHDCNPATQAMATPAKSFEEAKESKLLNLTKEWCGDVWKAIPHLRSTRPDLEVFVLDCDHGVGIVRKGEPAGMLNFSVTDIERMSYKDLEGDRMNILSLRDYAYLETFIERLRRMDK